MAGGQPGQGEGAEGGAAYLQQLYLQASTRKGALTRSKKALDFSITALREAPASEHFFEELKKNVTKYRELRDVVLDIYDNIRVQVTEQKFAKDFGKQQADIEGDYEKVEEASMRVIAAHQAAITAAAAATPRGAMPASAATGSAGAVQRWKLEASFQPKTSLRLDSKLDDFHCWQREFDAYFKMSNLEHAEVSIQKTVLLNCLDSDFQTKVSEAMSAITTVRAGLELVRQEFHKRHPLLLRRHQLFCLDQQKDEFKFSDTVTRMLTLAKDSDLGDMTRDQILCHILIRACSQDEELRAKLLEVDSTTMTLDQLIAVIERYELIQVTNRGLGKKEKGVGRRVGGREGGTLCFVCQNPRADHKASTCPVDKKTLFCQKCHESGLPAPHAHNTFAQCQGKKSKLVEEEEEKGNKVLEKGKGRQVHIRDLSPAGDPESSEEEEDEGFARRVRVEEPMSASSSESEFETDSGHVSNVSNTIFTDSAEDEEVEVPVHDTGWPVSEFAKIRYRGRISQDNDKNMTNPVRREKRDIRDRLRIFACLGIFFVVLNGLGAYYDFMTVGQMV